MLKDTCVVVMIFLYSACFPGPTLFNGRYVVMLLSDVLFGIIYIKGRKRAQDQVANKIFAMCSHVSGLSGLSVHDVSPFVRGDVWSTCRRLRMWSFLPVS
eukprot:4824065-Amphidinium_carterae.1